MDWTQTFTIIFTIIGSMVAVWYAFYHIIKEDIKRHDEDVKTTRTEFSKVHEEFKNIRLETRAEFSKMHALWADLLKQIYEIKLDQSKKA